MLNDSEFDLVAEWIQDSGIEIFPAAPIQLKFARHKKKSFREILFEIANKHNTKGTKCSRPQEPQL